MVGVSVAPSSRTRFHLTHNPALDGVRGVAMAGVLVFHTGYLGGGFLSVNLFFSLSGFLITTLLLEERLTTGGLRFKAFWLRRARRLLPALFGLVAGVGLYAAFLADPLELARLRDDVVATVLYVANWHSIVAGQEYWDLFSTPSLLQHTWTLAIEEQFYLVWPLILGGVLWWRRGSVPAVLGVCIAGAAAGALWMAVAFDPGHVSRTYLGTDTRMPALLVGAGLAAWLQWRGPVRGVRGRVALEVAGLAGALLLLVGWVVAAGEDPRLYRGGFALCDLAAVAVLAAASHPRPGRLARLLSWRPLTYLGLISYGLYLWHWPVIVVLDEARTGRSGPSLAVLQIAVSLVLGSLSFYLLERPIRRRGLDAWRVRPLLPAAAALALAATLVVTVVPRQLTPEQQAAGELIAAGEDAAAVPAVAALAGDADQPVARQHPELAMAHQPLPRPVGRRPRLLVVGDSVALSLGAAMRSEPDRWGVDVAIRAQVGCSLDSTSGRTRTDRGGTRQEPPVCQQWPSRWAQAVEQFRPDAVLVAFGGLEPAPRWVDSTWSQPCEATYQRWYRQQWDQALDVLAAGGAVPYVARPAAIDRSGSDEMNAALGCIRPLISAAVADEVRARLVALDTFVCETGDRCRRLEDGSSVRFDGAHYAGRGAEVVNQWLLEQIFQPARS